MTVATDDARFSQREASPTVKNLRRMTLKEFLTYDDGTDNRYELVDGMLVEMGAEATINTWIAGFLFGFFLQMGLPSYRIGFKQTISVRSSSATVRDPDLIIHSEDSAAAIADRTEACLFFGEAAPLIVIEVVSPGSESSDNYQRDYVQKPREYADRRIAEFWQIDPKREWVRVLSLDGTDYAIATFKGEEPIVSPTFPELKLTAEKVLAAGR